MYHVKERTATAVSPRLSLAAPAGGLPTQAQWRLGWGTSATPGCACSAGVLRAGLTPRCLDAGAARDSLGRMHYRQVGPAGQAVTRPWGDECWHTHCAGNCAEHGPRAALGPLPGNLNGDEPRPVGQLSCPLLRQLGLPLRGMWALTSSELTWAVPDGPTWLAVQPMLHRKFCMRFKSDAVSRAHGSTQFAQPTWTWNSLWITVFGRTASGSATACNVPCTWGTVWGCRAGGGRWQRQRPRPAAVATTGGHRNNRRPPRRTTAAAAEALVVGYGCLRRRRQQQR